MAGEIRFRVSLSGAKGGVSAAADTGERFVTMTGTKMLETIQTVGTAEEALILGELVATGAFYCIENLDTTNSVDLKWAALAVALTSIGPGLATFGKFGPSVTAPVVNASASTVNIKILLIEA